MSEVEKPARLIWLSIFTSRRRLMSALAAGLVVGGGLRVLEPSWSPATTMIVAWDVTCLVFLFSILPLMRRDGPDDIRAHSAQQDQGRLAILTLVLSAAAVSIWAIAQQLTLAKAEHGLLRTSHVGLAFVTVVLSWFMVQFVFALHYAHEYYDPDEGCVGDSGGLTFPGGEAPDYWDFLHFSIIIGVAAQTADIAFTSKGLRRIGTLHSLVAFAYNTVIVALTINLLAGLF
jgi:uncharacterized membrane protein